MTFNAGDMDGILAEFQPRTVELLRSKASDYAGKDDRLKNFREVALATGLEPAQVCLVYMHKHLNAIGTMAATGNYTWDWVKPDGSEGAKQRIADAINYLYLLAAIFEDEDRHNKEQTQRLREAMQSTVARDLTHARDAEQPMVDCSTHGRQPAIVREGDHGEKIKICKECTPVVKERFV